MPENTPSAKADAWASVPSTEEIIPFLTSTMRAELVNARAVCQVQNVVYEAHGQFGPKFVTTFTAPDGNDYQISFTSAGGRSPRDIINKWMFQQTRDGNRPIPAQLCKRGRAYMFDRPGSASERDTTAAIPSSSSEDIPDF
jgi:hypothetical protein